MDSLRGIENGKSNGSGLNVIICVVSLAMQWMRWLDVGFQVLQKYGSLLVALHCKTQMSVWRGSYGW